MPYQQPLSLFQESYGQNGHPAQPDEQHFPVENPCFAHFDDVLHQVRVHPDAGYAIHDVEGPSDDELHVDFGPEPEDLDERFHWHVSKRVQANMAKILTHQAKQTHARRKHRGYHVAVRGLEALDPLYERTMDVMQHYLENLPEVLKPLVMPTLARHSPSFLALYRHLRPAAQTGDGDRSDCPPGRVWIHPPFGVFLSAGETTSASEHAMYPTAASGSVYFFGTCLADIAFPQAGMAAMRLLKGLGVEVIFPLEQGCCGQPAYNSGFPDEARAVALRQVDIFSRSDIPVVVPSGSCAGMLRHHYPRLFAEHPRYFDVAAFSGRVFEFGDYLANVLKARFTDRGPPVTVTWHSSCHALRETGATAAAKSLLRQLANVTLVELVREHECCGFGGTFAVKRPEVSAAMVEDKVEDIRVTGASLVLSSDCGCLLNITGAMERQGLAVQGRHLAEFLWERTHA